MPFFRNIRRYSRQFVDACGDLILPRFCAVCGPCVAAGSFPHLCSTCVNDLILIDGDRQCRVCASVLTGFGRSRSRCLGCFHKRVPWSRLVVLGSYDGLLAELIRRLKFEGERCLGATLGELMAAQTQALSWDQGQVDAVVVIPLTRSRETMRGFNQAALIGFWVAEFLDVPLRESWLKRSDDGPSQVGHGATSRRKLSASGFVTAPNLFGKRVLLVDDVVTTQGTIRAASIALKKGGALDVKVLCCARTKLSR
ncbi:MAG: ComF family protein [Planctomycetota bacterium]|jgi:ComF family protein